jgi:hypothetical protein
MKLPYQSAFTRYLPLAILIVMALLLVHLLGCDGMQMAQAASSNAPVNVSGEFKGQMQHDPLFPAIDFNITVDITQQSGTSDIIPLQVTVLREATECWTSRPIAMTGNLVIHRDEEKHHSEGS